MSLDAVEYKNDSKRAWRCGIWNRLGIVRERALFVGPCLYLAGSRDLDGHLAVRHGVKDADLIAVETNPEVVARLRRNGRNTISAELKKVMEAWPAEHPVSLVLADLCTNLTASVVDIARLWATSPALARAPLVLNLQRGREYGELWEYMKTLMTPTASTNRAQMLYCLLLDSLARDISGGPQSELYFRALADLQRHFVFAKTGSYKSSAVYMDSAILLQRRAVAPWAAITYKSHPDADVRRKIAAALAIRTVRSS